MSFLLHNLLHFTRLLHRLGLDVQAGRASEVAAGLYVDVGRRADFYHTLLCASTPSGSAKRSGRDGQSLGRVSRQYTRTVSLVLHPNLTRTVSAGGRCDSTSIPRATTELRRNAFGSPERHRRTRRSETGDARGPSRSQEIERFGRNDDGFA